MNEQVPAAPFREWLRGRVAAAEADETVADPRAIVAESIGHTEKLIYRWLTGELADRVTVPATIVLRPLINAGVDPNEVYPGIEAWPARVFDRYCSTCRQEVLTDDSAECPWCDSPTTRKKRGKPTGVHGRLKEDDLRAMHLLHTQAGLSQRDLARQTWKRLGYKSMEVCATQISKGWKQLGLQARDRIEQTVISSTKHGRAGRQQQRDGGAAYQQYRRECKLASGEVRLVKCKGVRLQYPRKGAPCQRWAGESGYCFQHDPAHREEVVEIVRRTREASGVGA